MTTRMVMVMTNMLEIPSYINSKEEDPRYNKSYFVFTKMSV